MAMTCWARSDRARGFAATLLLSSVTSGGLAEAQPPSKQAGQTATERAAITSTEQAAENLHEEGVRAFRARRWEQARGSFLGAFRLRPDCRNATSLGKAEFLAGSTREAAEHLSLVSRECGKDALDDQARGFLQEARRKVAEVTIQVDTERAEIFVDGTRLDGRSPLPGPIHLEAGHHSIEARKAGGAPVTEEIDVDAGTASTVVLHLAPRMGAAEPARRQAGRASEQPEQKRERQKRWLLGISAGLAVTGTGIGVGFSMAAAAKDQLVVDGLKDLQAKTYMGDRVCGQHDCQPLHDLVHARDRYQTVAITGFVLGGLGVAGVVASVLWRPGAKADARAKTGLTVAPFHRGLIVTGSF